MAKTIAEINDKIKKGKAVILTKEEVLAMVKDEGVRKCAQEVDVVTTGTFGPMCSSMAIFNIGHSVPRMKIQKAWMNDVPCYGGLAAVDLVLGATELPEVDPGNLYYPGEFTYGGAHVIEDLVSGKDVRVKGISYGTDCYPRKELHVSLSLKDMNEAWLVNPRNAYQNYNVAVNMSDRTIYTYMGVLRPQMGNANYCSAGQLSPLLNDPTFRTIGVGTRIFLGGGIGYVIWHGTQHTTNVERTSAQVPVSPAGTLAVHGDLKQMHQEWLRAGTFRGYGVSLAVGIGVPIPILDEEMMRAVSVTDQDLVARVVEYSVDYPQVKPRVLAKVTYAQLKSGKITVEGKTMPTAGLSSYFKARRICDLLKEWMQEKKFLLTEPVAPLPGEGSGVNCRMMGGKEIR